MLNDETIRKYETDIMWKWIQDTGNLITISSDAQVVKAQIVNDWDTTDDERKMAQVICDALNAYEKGTPVPASEKKKRAVVMRKYVAWQRKVKPPAK